MEGQNSGRFLSFLSQQWATFVSCLVVDQITIIIIIGRGDPWGMKLGILTPGR